MNDPTSSDLATADDPVFTIVDIGCGCGCGIH